MHTPLSRVRCPFTWAALPCTPALPHSYSVSCSVLAPLPPGSLPSPKLGFFLSALDSPQPVRQSLPFFHTKRKCSEDTVRTLLTMLSPGRAWYSLAAREVLVEGMNERLPSRTPSLLPPPPRLLPACTLDNGLRRWSQLT